MNIARQYALGLTTMFYFFTLDFFFTKNIIDRIGFDAEANPIMHWLLTTFQTVWVLLAIKLLVLAFLWQTLLIVAAKGKPATKNFMVYALWVLVTVTVFVDLWSVHVLKVVS
jgi:hypothetical protein